MSGPFSIRRPTAVFALCWVAAALLGCCHGVGRGFSLRSEWTLEMNRGAGATCVQETCGTMAGQGQTGCGGSETCCAVAGTSSGGGRMGGGPCVGRRPCVGPLTGLFRMLTPPPPTLPAGAECGMYPRFHPVPAQPVFARRDLPRNVGSGFGPLPAEPPEASARQLVAPPPEAVSRQAWVPAR